MFFLAKTIAYTVMTAPLILGYVLLGDYLRDNGKETESAMTLDYAADDSIDNILVQTPQYVITEGRPTSSFWTSTSSPPKNSVEHSAFQSWSSNTTVDAEVGATKSAASPTRDRDVSPH